MLPSARSKNQAGVCAEAWQAKMGRLPGQTQSGLHCFADQERWMVRWETSLDSSQPKEHLSLDIRSALLPGQWGQVRASPSPSWRYGLIHSMSYFHIANHTDCDSYCKLIVLNIIDKDPTHWHISNWHVRSFNELYWCLPWSLTHSLCLSVRLAKVPNVWLLNERENVLVSSV